VVDVADHDVAVLDSNLSRTQPLRIWLFCSVARNSTLMRSPSHTVLAAGIRALIRPDVDMEVDTSWETSGRTMEAVMEAGDQQQRCGTV
jgi:hypothetical protein